MKKILHSLLSMACSAILLYSCTKPDDKPAIQNGFDKTAMLSSYAKELIKPSYALMLEKINALQSASDAFVANPNASTQNSLKTAYTETHLQYIRIAAFNFGPAESAILDNFLNFSGGLDYNFVTDGELTGFSVDSAAIENNIKNGSYNLTAMTRSSFYAQGFPALNYLYFAPNAISAMNSARGQYINALLARMKQLVEKVNNDWGAYESSFVGNTQTNSNSPIANIVNQLAYQLDLLKGPRVGWPLGKQSAGKIFATKCEAYYAGISMSLANENINSIKRLYTNNGNGKGISDYLIALKGENLNKDILNQIQVVQSALQSLPDPFSQTLFTQTAQVDNAYKEIQKLVTLVKTDLASATAVQISYSDNDGD